MDIDPIADWDGFQTALAKLESEADWQGLGRALREALRIIAAASVTHVGGRPKQTVETELWKRLGLVYRDRLGDVEGARTVFVLLTSRDPNDAASRDILTALRVDGSSQPTAPGSETLGAATAKPTDTLSPDDYADAVVFHLQRGELDAAWCVAAAAAYRGQAGAHVDFYEQYAPLDLTPFSAGLERPDWFALCHPDEIRAPRSVQQGIERCAKLPPPDVDDRARSRARLRFEPAALRSPMFRRAYLHAARVLGLPSRDHLSFQVTDEIVDAEGALDGVHDGFTLSELLFVAGKQAAYHREPVLQALSSYPGARELALAAGLDATPVQRWLRGVELTAVRAGLLVSGDLRTAKRVLDSELTLFREGLGVDEALNDLLAFATGPRYLVLRRKTGRALVSTEKPVRRRPPGVTTAPQSVTIGSPERRARTSNEMYFAASLHPCRTCGAAPRERDLDLRAQDDQRLLVGQCRFCSTPLRYAFFVDDDMPERFTSRHELGDARPSQIIEPAAFFAELDRLLPIVRAAPRELAPSEWSEALAVLSRAITCVVELLALVRDTAYADRATRAELTELRGRLLAIEGSFDADAPRVWEIARGSLDAQGEIRGLLQQACGGVPNAADLRAYFASRRKAITVTDAGETLVEVGSAAVARARILDDARGDTVAELALTSCSVDELRQATASHTKRPLGERPLDGTVVIPLVVEGRPLRVRADHRRGVVSRVVVTFLRPRAPGPTRLPEILQALLAEDGPPKTVGALAQALGLELTPDDVPPSSLGWIALPPDGHPPLATDVTSVSAKYGWDMFHERPVATLEDLLSRSLVEWTVGFAHPIGALEGALTSRIGPPRAVASSRVHGSWISTSTSDESATLSLHPKLPDWAVAPPDAALRERALVELAAAVAAVQDRAALAGAAASLPPGCGLVLEAQPVGSGHVPRLSIELVPAIAATDLARILGWQRPVGQTFTVHQEAWEIWLVTDRGDHGPALERPSFGAWNVTAILDGPPTGGPLAQRGVGPGPPSPPGATIGPGDRVRWLTIG